MLRLSTFAAIAGLAIGSAQAQEPTANCKLFIKGSDGKWIPTIDSKVGNPKQFKLLRKGQSIDPELTVVGINVSDTIDKLCAGK